MNSNLLNCRIAFLLIERYIGSDVIIDKPVVLNSSCTVGDRSYNVRDRACIFKFGLRFDRA